MALDAAAVRLSEGEVTALRMVVEAGHDLHFDGNCYSHGHPEDCWDIALREAATAKAAWAIVDWLLLYGPGPFAPAGAVLRAELNAAGLPRPTREART